MPDDKIMIVTGASSGIGEATARLFARKGYRVVLAARRFDRLEALAREIKQSGGDALPVATDVGRLEEIQRLVQTTMNTYGQVDVLFNNAGFGRLNWLDQLDPEGDIAALLQVNLVGTVQMARAVLPHMIQRRQGHIINMASIAGLIGTPTYSIYAASKFAIRGFSEALRREVSVYGLHVSTIYPGSVETEFRSHAGAKRKTGVRMPGFLRLESEEVANAVWGLERRPRATLIIPWTMRLAVWFNTLFPGIVDEVIERRFVRRERLGS